MGHKHDIVFVNIWRPGRHVRLPAVAQLVRVCRGCNDVFEAMEWKRDKWVIVQEFPEMTEEIRKRRDEIDRIAHLVPLVMSSAVAKPKPETLPKER